MNKTPFDDIYSHHPAEGGDPLANHLPAVASLAREHVCPDEQAPNGTPTETIAYVAGECHDIGKGTTWFQRHLDGQFTPDYETHHSPLGALAVYYCLRERGASHEDAFVGLIAVAKHHGSLPNVAQHVKENLIKDTERKSALEEQVDDIHERADARRVVGDALDRASDGAADWDGFQESVTLGDIYTNLGEHAMKGRTAVNRSACSASFYEAVVSVWAGLTKADKIDAAALPEAEEPDRLRQGAVADYIKGFDAPELESLEASLNEDREQARQTVRKAVHRIPSDGGVGTITLPTGLGKTLSSLDAAVEHLASHTPDEGRIIYALPYTSIVDQTADEVVNVFNVDTQAETDRIDPYGWALTIDHHLESTATRLGDETDDRTVGDDEETDEFAADELLLGSMWGSGVVVTTYVQLFESLVSPSNSQSLKIPNLRDSVIVLDEPQTIPLDWWPIIRRVVNTLTETFDATVLSMSATQPHLFTNDEAFEDDIAFDAPELVDETSEYFETFHRTDYHLHDSVARFLSNPVDTDPLDHGTAADTVATQVCENQSSALAICNTIRSARELSGAVQTELASQDRSTVDLGDVFDDLLADVDETDSVSADDIVSAVTDKRGSHGVVTLHLTTRHRPADRRIVLEAAKELATDDVPFVFVATQLVEAGVDVSFRRVYRDLAPMPSLIQAAGRCNRSFEWGNGGGDVTVWRLGSTEDNSNTPSTAIYGRGGEYNLLDVTRTALNEVTADEGVVPDTEISEAGVKAYYDTLVERQPGDWSLVGFLNSGQFATLREEAEYIDQRDTVEVVVCRVEEDDTLVEKYQSQADADDYQALRRTRARLTERAVSVPRDDYNQAQLNATVLSTTADGDHGMVAVDAARGRWFSSTYGADAEDAPLTPQPSPSD